jgi:hypothetical protein
MEKWLKNSKIIKLSWFFSTILKKTFATENLKRKKKIEANILYKKVLRFVHLEYN